MEDQLQHAVKIVRDGGIIIYPTDTAFGIGCRVDSQQAVDRLFALRRRPVTKATPVLVSSIAMALSYLSQPSDIVRRFMKRYWPGALTIISQCKKDLVYSPVRGDGETIGLRQPDHVTPCSIIEAVGVPILGPSANFAGDPTPYTTGDLNPELTTLVDYVMQGACTLKQASTVVDCSVNPYKIIRRGAIDIDVIT